MLSRTRGTIKKGQKAEDWLGVDDLEDIQRFFSRTNQPSILGSREFIDQIKNRFFNQIVHPETSRIKDSAQKSDKILELVCIYFNVDRVDLNKQKRGTFNSARDLAMYLVRLKTNLTLAEIGKLFNISNYSSVSSVIERMKLKLQNDEKLKSALKKIELNC